MRYTGDDALDKVIARDNIPEELWAVKWIELNWGSLENAPEDFGGEDFEIVPECLADEIELYFQKSATEVQ